MSHLHFFEQLEIRATKETNSPGTISKHTKSIIRLINDECIHYPDIF